MTRDELSEKIGTIYKEFGAASFNNPQKHEEMQRKIYETYKEYFEPNE